MELSFCVCLWLVFLLLYRNCFCLVIPFYIPQIFFASNYLQTLWALLTFFIPQIVFIIMGVTDILKDVKEYKAKTEQLEKERLLQEQREELGKWK